MSPRQRAGSAIAITARASVASLLIGGIAVATIVSMVLALAQMCRSGVRR